MNKRQAKKAYKKKYGHNPPKQPYGAREFLEWGVYVAEGLQEGIKAAVDNVTEAIGAAAEVVQNMLKDLPEILNATRERIRTMPEEEFYKMIESPYLEDGAKRLAWKIRMIEGSTENGERGKQHITSCDSAADEEKGTGNYTGNGEKRTS